jgi:signal transduction histidine kinase
VGTILPLVQQVREDLERGTLDPLVLDQDLAVVVEKALLCQRIFSNMLRVAHTGRAGDGPVDLNQVVEETLPFFAGQALRRDVETVLDLAPELPLVRFSRQDLQHMVLNLVGNSLDALAERPEGGGRLRISTGEEDGGARLSIEDDGPGIGPELLEKVQEPFFTTKEGGTGLGLAICRALAWQNGGHLKIESDPGAGTRVTVELRLAKQEALVGEAVAV